jgi:hypothetical protein
MQPPSSTFMWISTLKLEAFYFSEMLIPICKSEYSNSEKNSTNVYVIFSVIS